MRVKNERMARWKKRGVDVKGIWTIRWGLGGKERSPKGGVVGRKRS